MTARFIFGAILIVLGIGALTGIPLVHFLIAFLFVYFGVRLLTGKPPRWDTRVVRGAGDRLNEVVLFGPFNRVVSSHAFRGGKVVLIFAGGELDLSEAKAVTPDVALELVVIFGSARVVVPDDWIVRTRGTAVIGGYDNKAQGSGTAATFTLTGIVICGGVGVVR